MTFVKGVSGNPAGARPGSLHRRTKEHLSRAQKLIEAIEAHENFAIMLDGLTPREMAALYKDLMEYLEPKLQRMEVVDNNDEPRVIKVVHSVDLPARAVPSIENIVDTIPIEIVTPIKTDAKKPF